MIKYFDATNEFEEKTTQCRGIRRTILGSQKMAALKLRFFDGARRSNKKSKQRHNAQNQSVPSSQRIFSLDASCSEYDFGFM